MPAKNVVKTYVENGYYHIYNRGVEKRIIFQDDRDYKVFLRFLKEYLSPPPTLKNLRTSFTLQGSSFQSIPHQTKNYHQEIELLAYCLMPNHFHLLIHQKTARSIDKFMKSLLTRYVIYFNKRNSRTGPLFQGIYKAILVQEEPYLLHLSRYIHLNPSEYTLPLTSAYSSYANYLGLQNTPWIKTDLILSFFNQATLPLPKNITTYQQFVEEYQMESQSFLDELTLELEPVTL